jgi:hypothetical protein
MSNVFGTCIGCTQYRKLVVDHDHETGKIRGLICNACNCALGFVRDEPDTMRRLIAYLAAPPMASFGFDWGTDITPSAMNEPLRRPEVRMLHDTNTVIAPEIAESVNRQVIELVHSGATVPFIVEQVYGVNRSRGSKYAEATETVMAIIRQATLPSPSVVPPAPVGDCEADRDVDEAS